MIKVFKYIIELDCFDVTPEFKRISEELGLVEWNEVVWIGRFFLMDNDFGEHWLDNWNEREQAEEKAKQLGLISQYLFFIDPDRFKDEKDGPCHSSEQRKKFWTDVCKSLHLSIETIIAEAKMFNEENKKRDEPYIQDLEERINQITNRYKIL